MSDIPRVVFADYKRKLPVAMTQKGKRPSTGARGFFGTHELPGADWPIQKAAPRRPSGYVTTIGTEPQVAPFRAAILRGSAADLVHLEFQRGHGVRNRGGAVTRRLLEPPIPLPVANGADSGGSRPRIRDDVAHHSDLISPGVPR
jgi:hypothetical protein